MILYGKGYYIWKIPKCDGGVPSAIAARAAAAQLSHVLIKIADGTSWKYNYDYDTKTDLVPPVASALRDLGISVWGWHYIRGDNPVEEARLAIDRTLELGMDGYVIDAEGQFERSGKRAAAKRFMQELRAGLPDLPVALSTYRFPRGHMDFPYAEFLEKCDLAMPQVYFEEAHNPEQQLERCVEQYMALEPARPVTPTAPTYITSVWSPTASEIKRFLTRAKELGLTAVNAWSWDFATHPSYIDLWNTIADFEWPPKEPVGDVPERIISYLNQHDATSVAALYRENAAHVTGTRTVVGVPAITEWYKALFAQLLPNGKFELTGKSGTGNSRHYTWTATSDSGRVLDGNDTLGLNEGEIQYHYTYFTIS